MKFLVQQLLCWLLLLFSAVHSWADTLPLENGDIHDIYGPIAISEQRIWFYVLAAALLFLALFCMWFFLLRKRKPKTETETPIHETALAELARARKYLEQNRSLQYAQKASLVLRNYLELRFHIHSTRQTTTEFLASIDQISSFSKAMLQPYRNTLQRCLELFDLAKYAHKTTKQDTMEQLEDSIRTFILETTSKESE